MAWRFRDKSNHQGTGPRREESAQSHPDRSLCPNSGVFALVPLRYLYYLTIVPKIGRRGRPGQARPRGTFLRSFILLRNYAGHSGACSGHARIPALTEAGPVDGRAIPYGPLYWRSGAGRATVWTSGRLFRPLQDLRLFGDERCRILQSDVRVYKRGGPVPTNTRDSCPIRCRPTTKVTIAGSVLSLIILLAAPGTAVGQSTAPTEHRPETAQAKKNGKKKIDPTQAAAQQQSGLNEAQAISLAQSKGFGAISSMHAEPNSIWVWQADAMKNGRRVRVGIDFRGNVVDISGGINQPCTSLGVRVGAASTSVGSRLLQADTCSTRATGG